MSNVTNLPLSAIPTKYLLYVVEGFVMAFTNLLIVFTVLRNKQLRTAKEYIIMASLSLSDAIAGIAYMTAGLWRSYIITTGQQGIQVTSWDCMQKPHNWFLIFGTPLSALMLSCVSIDRLVAVWSPIRYFNFTKKYAHKLVGAFYSFGLFSFCILCMASYLHPRDQLTSLNCLANRAVGNLILRQYYYLVKVVSGLFSVSLYIFIPFLYRHSMKKLTGDGTNEAHLKRQKKLMVTYGISAGFTFLLFVCPNFVRTVFVNYQLCDLLCEYAACIQNLNPILNVVLYLLRHGDIRVAVGNFLKCKETPIVSVGTTTKNRKPTAKVIVVKPKPN